MKSKITRIWGIGLIVVLLTSLLVMAAPASAADPLQWNNEGIPGPPASAIVPGLEILDFAVAGDGMTTYAVGLIRGNETVTATCNFTFVGGSGNGENLTMTYINENGQVGRAGTIAFVGTANVTAPATTGLVTLQLGDAGISSITAVAEVASTATAGQFRIASNTTGVVFGYYDYATATWNGVAGATTDNTKKLYKSTNAGMTWTDITPTAVGFNILNTQFVAVAPDDPSIVVVADNTTANIAAANCIYVSTDGGTNFGSLGAITAVGGPVASTIHDLQISSRVSPGIRYIACPGRTGDAGNTNGPGLFTYNLHAASPAWRNVVNADAWWTTGLVDATTTGIDDFVAFEFSPSFAADFTGAVLGYEAGAGIGSELQLHVVSFNLKNWNSFSLYPVTVDTSVNGAYLVQAADLALAPDFVGGDDVSRVYFVGASILDVAAQTGGIYRCDDNATPLEMRTNTAVNTVDFNGTDLVAGAYDTNTVYRCPDPLASSPTVRPSRANKEIGVDSALPTPRVNDQVIVAWNGEDVLGAKMGDASAFSISRDNGLSWNDRSLIDSGFPYTIDDIYVTEDASKVYVCANDGTETSVYRGVMGMFERVLTLANANGYILRGTPADSDIVYVADIGGTAIFYASEAGDNRWYSYTAVVSGGGLTDLAAENDDVVYIGDATTVVKSVNNGFTWDPPVTPELSGDAVATLYSVAEDKLIAGGTMGHVSYTTDGSETWFRIIYPIVLPPQANNVHVIATGLDAGDKILAAGSLAGNSVYQWTVGDSPMTEWVAIGPGGPPLAGATGISYVGGALYVSFNDGANVNFRRCLGPLGPGGWEWSLMQDAGAQDNGAVSILKVSSGSNKIWYAQTLATVKSYQDTLVDAYPEVTAPADGYVVSVNPVTGRSVDVAFNWNRPSDNTEIYELSIYTDPIGFNRVASISIPNPGPKAVVLVGPYQAGLVPYAGGGDVRTFEWNGGQTYYWKVRVSSSYGSVTPPGWTGPIFSQWSPMRSLVVESGAASVPQISSPVNGAGNVNAKPAFSWSPVEGATEYQFELDAVTTFAVPLFTTTLSETGIAPDVTLEAGKTYFWRVRANAPNVGNWSTIANFTVAVPVVPTKPAEITIPEIKVPEITIPQITVPETKVVIQEAEKVTEPAISEGLLLAIIIIGAVLVIALIVLIVRTRRQV